ncbi:lysozyme inhibitor LprI family protein [Sphingomonas humi]|uniref:lysozyme inhibitor LprI family protein n=1 Tax=Sphingomonas humi TaxID=335630 RepID=UPI0031E0A5BA
MAAAPAPRWDWSTADLDWLGGNDREYKESRAICARVIHAEPPTADRPTPAQAKALKGCDSEALYYGIGVKADPVKARLCAFTEKDEEVGVFGGRAMLMTIYANGRGAARDLKVATHLACGLEEAAPMEHALRIPRLQKLKPGKPFSICDAATSGYLGGACTEHDSRFAIVKRDRAIAALARQEGYAGSPLFAAGRRAMESYASAHAGQDQDLSGTLRVAFAVGAEETVRDQFLATLQALASGKLPPASAATYARSDAELNATYRATLADDAKDDRLTSGTITEEGRRIAARSWIAYRDAMLAFAARHYPKLSRTALATYLTRQRLDDLGPIDT